MHCSALCTPRLFFMPFCTNCEALVAHTVVQRSFFGESMGTGLVLNWCWRTSHPPDQLSPQTCEYRTRYSYPLSMDCPDQFGCEILMENLFRCFRYRHYRPTITAIDYQNEICKGRQFVKSYVYYQ